jgi:hypothetical protein
MARKKKQKKLGWKDIEKIISKFDTSQFTELIRDLYHLSADNKDFFLTRFSIGDDPLLTYKKIIQDSVHPYLEDHETLEIENANDAINRYLKAVDNLTGEAELRFFYVECGNNFTLSYGDIDEDFYDAMLNMYEDAVKTVLKLSPREREVFRTRLQNIIESANGIGWGYYDGLCDLYEEAFPED